jgi:hypothetical protein
MRNVVRNILLCVFQFVNMDNEAKFFGYVWEISRYETLYSSMLCTGLSHW